MKSFTVYFETCCSVVVSALACILSSVLGFQGFDGQRVDRLPLFHHVLVSWPDALKTFLPVDVDPRQRVLTGQGDSFSFFGLHMLQMVDELCWDG